MSTSARASNPGYVTARVRARKAKLFEEEDYRKLVRMAPSGIARFMEESEYEDEINRLGSRHGGVDLIEYALNENLARHFHDILGWAEGQLYEQIANYVRKFDAWNAKTALRGIYSGTDAEEIRTDFIPAGEFDERLLDELAAADSVETVVELLDRTIFGDAVAEAYEEYEETGLLVPIENAIDREFYEHLLDGVEDVEVTAERGHPVMLYVEFLQAEIDFRNVRNALRLSGGTDIDPAEYYIAGGRLFTEDELRLLVEDETELIARIRESTYGNDLSGALSALEDADSLVAFERALEAALLRYSDQLSYRFPLSICPVLAYVLAKEREVENIRAIARGKEAGLDRTEVEEELVIT